MKALLAKIREILRNRKTRRLWVRVISLMACVVVFISTYALVLPAITMEIEASCGIEAHQHTDECYENVLVCGQEESEDHQHTDSCYEQVLACGKEEHIHSTECYKEETDSETTAVATTQAASGSVILDPGETDASATENDAEESLAGDSASSEGADSGDSYVDTTSEIENVPDETASDTDQYVPALDPVYFNEILSDRTGIYYYNVQPDETIADSAEITDWKKIEQNTADDTQLGKGDLLRVYLAYTIPAGSLNETNEVARYRLPGNLHLTDEQVEAINSTENGVAGQYIDYDTLEILDTDNYYRYLGAEAVEGTRTPSDDIEKYLSKHGGQEYISAVVRVENVYDQEGVYGEPGAYLGQDLVFTFTPYTIEKNRHEYDADGQPVKAGQTVNGWMTLDFNMDQVDWENDQEFVDAAAEQKKADIVFAQEEKDLKIEQISSELHLVERSDQEVVDSVEDTDELREETDSSVEGQDAETAENVEAETPENASESLTEGEALEEAEAGKTDESSAIEDDASEAGETGEKAVTADKAADEEEAGKDKTAAEEETEKEENPADKAASEEEEAAETAEGADTAEEAEDSEEKQPSEPAMPAQSFEETISVKTGTGAYTGKSGALPKKGDILVHVEADEGAFPAGTTMKVSALDRNTQNAVGDAVESAVDARTKGFQAVDIAFFDADGKEIEPLKPIRVSMTSSVISQAADSEHAGETVVVHVDDAGTAQVIGGTGDISDADQAERVSDPENRAVESADVNAGAGISSEAPDQISFNADRFSTYVLVYTVDFHYEVDGKTYQFTLEGGDSTGLSAVLRALSVVEESRLEEFVSNIETVEFSDPELVQVSHRTKTLGIFGTEDWTLKSLKPFDTTESLTVTLLDGETFVIRVTDAQIVTNYLSADGTSYRITVIYDESAGIPEDAELSVREIEKGTEEFDSYLNQSMDQLGAGDGEVFFARFFDVGIVKDGEKIEPQTPVSVVVEYDQALDLENTDADQMNVVHFADDGTEVIERVSVKDSLDSIAWKQDGFSVTGTILTGAPSNGSNYMVLVEYEGKYYIVNNDGSLTEVDYDTANGTVDVDDPMLWTYTGSNLYHNSIQVDFGSNQCASDYYYRYINPNDDDSELEKENSTIQEDSMAGISADTADNTDLKRNSEQVFDWNTWRWSTFNYYTVQTTPGARSEMARAGLRYSNNRIESTATPGNFIGLEFNEFGTPVRITGRADSENAATIKLAKVGDVLQSQHYLNNTVNHIDISIVGTAAVDIPLAYGKYYNADGEEILNVTEAKSLHLSEDHVGIKTDDMKRARIEAFTLDSNGSKVPLDDAYVISGYSANAETAYSTDQVRIEGVFLVSTDSQQGREIGYDWNYYNSHRDQIWHNRKDKRVYYTVTAIKPITFDLVDPEVGQLYDADGNKMTITVDVAFSASFDYWDPDNECPPLQYNTAWQNGDIPDHNLSGMDFVLGGNPDDINSEILAIEITKLIVDENGNRIKTATPITNTFGVYKDKIHKAIDEAGNLKEIGNETYDVGDYQYLHPKTITISENSDGLGLVYDYEVNEGSAKDGLYLVKEDKDSVPDTIIDKSGNIWNYKKTYFETEYAWRNNSTYDGKVHTSQDYTKDDPELVSKPEVLGRYYEYNGNNVHRNGFLEFFVYNVYESPKVDVPVFKTWNAFEDNKFDWEAEFQLQWAPLNSEGKLTDIFRDVSPAQIKTIKKSDLANITPEMIQEYLAHLDEPDYKPTTYEDVSVFDAFTFKDLPKYTTDMNGNAIRIQYSLEELSYEVKEKDPSTGNVINTYTWSKEDGYKKNGQPDDDQANHFEAFYPHDAGEEDEENTDYYVGVANAVRNVREKELVDISLHKEWDSSVEGYQDVNRWAEFELRRYVHTEYRDLSHLTTEDILADPITIQIVDANGHVLDSIMAQPNTGLFLAGNFAAHNADKSITFTYPDGGETQTVVVTAEGANASKQLVRSGEFFITEEMLQEQASPAGDRTFTITLTEGADNLVGGANGARILDTSGGTGPLPDRSFSQTVRLDKDNNWTYTWEDLLENETAQGDDDKNENVTCYEYYLVEKGCSPESSAQYYLADSTDASGKTATEMKLGDVDNRIEDGGADSSASIVAINKLAKRLKVEKEWRGVADTTGFPEIRFTLYQGWLSGEGNTATVSTEENDSWPFEHGLETAPANGTTENPTYQDIVLKDGAWEWTCPEDLPATMKDPENSNRQRNVGYYIKEETTSGSVGSTTWSFYYYANSNGQQTNDAAQGGETGLSGTFLSENGGSIKVVNRLGSYLPLDIKKKFYSPGENGTWTDTTSANLTDTILGIQLIRAVRTPDGKYLDASGNVVTDPVWTDYGDELLAGYDDSGNKVTRNSGSNDFYIEGGEGDWYFRIRDEQSGSVDLNNDRVGLPANGFYVRNGESISVSYLYSWRESGVYEYEGRDSVEDGGAIHVKASDRAWTSSVTPDVYVDSNGQHALDIDGISTGQTDGSVANFQAAKLKVEKEWIGENTEADEIYVKIYRTAAGSDEKEDVTALIAEDIQNNGNRLNALDNIGDIDLDHAWLVLKADNWQTGFVTVPVGTRDSLGEYHEYSYYIEEVGYKPAGESGADQGTSEVITDVSQFRPVYSRFVNEEWVSAGNNAGENAAAADPDAENRFKVTNRTTPSTSYTVTKEFEGGYPTDGSAQVTMTLQENYKENESDSGFAGEWQEAASANPVSITLPRPKPAKKPENDPQITSSTALADKEWSEVTDEDWAAVTDQEWYGSAAAWTYTWTGLDITKTIEGGTGSDPTEVPLYYRAQETGGAAWFEPVITETETPQDQEAGHKAVDDEGTSDSGNEQEHNEITNRKASFSLEIDKEWTGLAAGETWPEGFAVDYQLMQHYHLAGVPGGNSGSSVLSGIGPAFKTVEMQKNGSGSSSEDDDSVHTDAAGTLDKSNPQKNIDGLPAYAIFTPTADDVTEAAAAGVSLTAGDKYLVVYTYSVKETGVKVGGIDIPYEPQIVEGTGVSSDATGRSFAASLSNTLTEVKVRKQWKKGDDILETWPEGAVVNYKVERISVYTMPNGAEVDLGEPEVVLSRDVNSIDPAVSYQPLNESNGTTGVTISHLPTGGVHALSEDDAKTGLSAGDYVVAYRYRITEDPEESEAPTDSAYTYTSISAEPDGTHTATLINEYRDITVEKKWRKQDANNEWREVNFPDGYVVNWRVAQIASDGTREDNYYTAYEAGDGGHDLRLTSDNPSRELKYLPARGIRNGREVTYSYEVYEVAENSTSTNAAYHFQEIQGSLGIGANSNTYTLTNDLTDVRVKKEWEGTDDGTNVTVQLYASYEDPSNIETVDVMVVLDKWVPDGTVAPSTGSVTGRLTGSDGSSRDFTLTPGGGWKQGFSGLPKYDSNKEEIIYTVENLSGADGVTGVANDHRDGNTIHLKANGIEDTTEYPVTFHAANWYYVTDTNHENPLSGGLIPSGGSITATITKVGESTPAATVTLQPGSGTNWTDTVNLRKGDYTIAYSTTGGGPVHADGHDTLTVTGNGQQVDVNGYVIEKINVPVNVTGWRDSNNNPTSAPESASIRVKIEGGGVIEYADLSGDGNNWHQTVVLDKTTASGEMIQYSVSIESKSDTIDSISGAHDFSGADSDYAQNLVPKLKRTLGPNEVAVTIRPERFISSNNTFVFNPPTETDAYVKLHIGDQDVYLNHANGWEQTIVLEKNKGYGYSWNGDGRIITNIPTSGGNTTFSTDSVLVYTAHVNKTPATTDLTINVTGAQSGAVSWNVNLGNVGVNGINTSLGEIRSTDSQHSKTTAIYRNEDGSALNYTIVLQSTSYYFSSGQGHSTTNYSWSVVGGASGTGTSIPITVTDQPVTINLQFGDGQQTVGSVQKLQQSVEYAAGATRTFLKSFVTARRPASILSTLDGEKTEIPITVPGNGELTNLVIVDDSNLPEDAVQVGTPVTLDANSVDDENNSTPWEHMWKNLPKTDANGRPIYYYVVETAATAAGATSASASYSTVTNPDGTTFVTITNTTTDDSEKGKLEVFKEISGLPALTASEKEFRFWLKNAATGKYLSKVSATEPAEYEWVDVADPQNEESIPTFTIQESQKYTFNEMPVGNYILKETTTGRTVEHYVFAEGQSVTGTADSGIAIKADSTTSFTFKNVYEPETTSVTVTKEWENADGTTNAPKNGTVTFDLYRNGTKVSDQSITLNGTIDDNEKTPWVAEWTGLRKYDELSGEEYTYTVKEDGDGWEYYTVVYPEDSTPGSDSGSHKDSASDGETITNTENTTRIDVTKQWKNVDEDKVFDEEKTIFFTLWQSYTREDSTVSNRIYTNYNGNGRGLITYHPAVEEPETAAYWDTVEITDLPVKAYDSDGHYYDVSYYVVEDHLEDVDTTYTNGTDTDSDAKQVTLAAADSEDPAGTITIINKDTTTTLTVEKSWGTSLADTVPYSITYHVQHSADNGRTWVDYDSKDEGTDPDIFTMTYTPAEEPGGAPVITGNLVEDLPIGGMYRVREISYSITVGESTVTRENLNVIGTSEVDDNSWKSKLTNKLDDITISGSKTWVDNKPVHTDPKLTLRRKLEGGDWTILMAKKEAPTVFAGEYILGAGGEGLPEGYVNLQPYWRDGENKKRIYTYAGLPMYDSGAHLYTYEVTEDEIPHYVTEEETHDGSVNKDFINTEVADLKVRKKWFPGAITKPDIQFDLEKKVGSNGEWTKVGETHTLTKNDNDDTYLEWDALTEEYVERKASDDDALFWAYTFVNLPRYEIVTDTTQETPVTTVEPVIYRVIERKIGNQDVTYTGDDYTGTNVQDGDVTWIVSNPDAAEPEVVEAGEDPTTVMMVNDQEFVSLSGKKTWVTTMPQSQLPELKLSLYKVELDNETSGEPVEPAEPGEPGAGADTATVKETLIAEEGNAVHHFGAGANDLYYLEWIGKDTTSNTENTEAIIWNFAIRRLPKPPVDENGRPRYWYRVKESVTGTNADLFSPDMTASDGEVVPGSGNVVNVNFTNTEQTKIKVKKVWKLNGEETTEPFTFEDSQDITQIKLHLYQLGDSQTELVEKQVLINREGTEGNYTWPEQTVTGLPKYYTKGNDLVMYKYYFVEDEEGLDGWHPAYSSSTDNGQTWSDPTVVGASTTVTGSTGTATLEPEPGQEPGNDEPADPVINEIKVENSLWATELPASGGPGTKHYYVLGTLMTVLAGVWYMMRRRRA